MRRFKHGDDWYVRKPTGETINLNTQAGAEYVLSLQDWIAKLEVQTGKGGKPGPSETKRGKKK